VRGGISADEPAQAQIFRNGEGMRIEKGTADA